jgi:hypothetical protein
MSQILKQVKKCNEIIHFWTGSCLIPALIILIAAYLSTWRGLSYFLGTFPARTSFILE